MSLTPRPNLNDRIQDGFLAHSVNILKVAAGQRKDVLSFLETLEKDLTADLANAADKSPLNVARLQALLAQTQKTITKTYATIEQHQGASLEQIAHLEATKTVNVVNGTIGVAVASVAMSPEQLAAIAGKSLVNGKHPAAWWKDQSATLQDDFARQMRMGMARGEGIEDLVRRVRGTKAKGYTDGIMALPKARATALVRTSVQTVANEARIKSIETMGAVVKGIQWVSTLDSRTSPICRALDGLEWTVPGFEPVGHDKTFPGPVAHWQCRSTQVPVTRSWSELAGPNSKLKDPKNGKPLDLDKALQKNLEKGGMTPDQAEKVKAQTRASMDGQVGASLDFEEWLKGKRPDFQDSVLGKAKAQLWREGKLTLAEMTNQDNVPLSLDELHALVLKNEDVKPAQEGQDGLNLMERKILEEHMAQGAKAKETHTTYLNQDTGERVTVASGPIDTGVLGDINAMEKVTVLSNTLEPGAVWNATALKQMASVGGLQKALLVDPDGRVITLEVKPGKKFLPQEAKDIVEQLNSLPDKTPRQFRRILSEVGESLKVTWTDAGAVKPPAKVFLQDFPALIEKPAPFFDAKAEAEKQAKLAAEKAAQEAKAAAEKAAAEKAAAEAAAAKKAEEEAQAAKIAANNAALAELYSFKPTTPEGVALKQIQASLTTDLAPAELLAKVKALAAEKKAQALQAQHLAGFKKNYLAGKPVTSAQAASLGALSPEAAQALIADLDKQKAALAAIAAAEAAKKAAEEAEAKLHAEAQAKIAEVLQVKKGPDYPLAQQLPKTMAANPNAKPAELLAMAQEAVLTAKADNVKKQLLAGATKNYVDGKALTPAQKAALDALTIEEQAQWGQAAMDAKAAKEAKGHAQAAHDASAQATQAATEAVQAATPIVAPTPPKPIAAPEPKDFPADPLALTVVKTLGGSTGAQLVQDAQGNRYVRKMGASPDHVREEVLADAIYRGLGADVPEAKLYDTKQGPVKLARFVEGETLASYLQKASPAEKERVKKELQRNFAADAMMGNWDVLGTGKDNVLIGKDGRVWRIDNGGSLRFRAQGAAKAPQNWHAFANELWTMRGIYSTPTLEALKTGIAAGFQNDFREFFGSVTIYDIARQASAWDPKVLDLAPAEVRAVLEPRMEHLRALAQTALDLEHGKWAADVADKVVLSAMEMRQAGIQERMTPALTLKKGSPIMVDANGKEFDDLRSKGTTLNMKTAAAPQDPFAMQFKQAVISVNAHHNKATGKFANPVTIQQTLAMEAQVKEWKASTDAAKQAVADFYLPWLEKIKTAQANYNAGKVEAQGGAVLPMFDDTAGAKAFQAKKTPEAVQKPKPASSIGQDVAAYIASLGSDPRAVAMWMGSQASSSWQPNARALKYFIATSSTHKDPEKAYFWHTGGMAASKAAFDSMAAQVGGEKKLRDAFAAWIAYTQEVLATTTLPNVDKARRCVLLVRTEEDVVLSKQGVKIGQYGGTHAIQRAASESHGSIGLSQVLGDQVTVQAVPFSKVFGLYIQERPGAAGSAGSCGAAFLGNGENEYVADTNGIPFVYAGEVTQYGSMIPLAKGPPEWKAKLAPGFDLGTDAATWGVPLDHLRKNL